MQITKYYYYAKYCIKAIVCMPRFSGVMIQVIDVDKNYATYAHCESITEQIALQVNTLASQRDNCKLGLTNEQYLNLLTRLLDAALTSEFPECKD